MLILNRFLAAFDAMSMANANAELFRLTDNQLKARGYDREMLTRSYISGLGAH